MNLVIFGPPGAGKGTQSAKLVKEFNLFQLSTGDLLRDEVSKKTSFGNKIEEIMKSGGLVSDEIINNLIENKISNPEYKNRIIFDGFPRNIEQAKNLDILLFTAVVIICFISFFISTFKAFENIAIKDGNYAKKRGIISRLLAYFESLVA